MSFQIAVSGHTDDESKHDAISRICVEHGRAIVAELREIGVEPSYAAFSGPESETFGSLLEAPPG